jgi:hypothetical protein
MLQQITNRLKRHSFRLAIQYLSIVSEIQTEHCKVLDLTIVLLAQLAAILPFKCLNRENGTGSYSELFDLLRVGSSLSSAPRGEL